MQEPVRIAIFAGTFASQPLVFAHLADAMPWLELDAVEVICGTDPRPRLAHALAPSDARAIEDALGLHTTVVLVYAEAVPEGRRLPASTGRLMWLSSVTGVRHLPDPP